MAKSSRSTGTSALLPSGSTLPTNPVKPFDWTYSTLHPGVYTFTPSTSSSAADADDGKSPKKTGWRPADPEDPNEGIPLELLSRPDPILFYDEIALFESELDDNGSSCLSVRVVRFSFSSSLAGNPPLRPSTPLEPTLARIKPDASLSLAHLSTSSSLSNTSTFNAPQTKNSA